MSARGWRAPLFGLAMLAILAATLVFSASSTTTVNAQGSSSCVSDALLERVRFYYDINTAQGRTGENWKRVLIAFGDVEDSQLTPFPAADALVREARWSGWKPIRQALECIEAAAEVAPTPTPTPTPTATPAPTSEISIAAGSGVTEGAAASFTVTASPAPASDLAVTVTVSQSGDFASTGSHTVTIPASGSYTLTVSTTNDSADEPDGSVTATLGAGTGYTVSSSSGAATVAVSDDDVPELSIASGGAVTEGAAASFTVTASPTPHSALVVSVTVSATGTFGVTTGSQSVTIPTSGSRTFTVSTSGDATDEPDGSVTATLGTGAGYTVSSSAGAATVAVSDDDDPLPAPTPTPTPTPTPPTPTPTPTPTPDPGPEAQDTSADCTLPADAVTVAEVTGWRDALDPVKATAGIKRWNRVLEALGQDTGTGVTAMTPEQAQNVADWLGNTRWDRTARTISAAANCDVEQDEQDAQGEQAQDAQDAQDATPDTDTTDTDATPDTTDTKTPPTPSTTNSKPELSVVGGSAITEGGSATFTVTANPAPTGTIAITFVAVVTQDGRFTSSDGQIVDSIGRSGSITITVPTLGDDRDEPDGSLTLTLQADTREIPRFTVSATQGAATVVVTDDDAPGSGATLTYTEFWAPYQDLIARVEETRNDPLYGQFTSHTDLYDSVLLALGQDVAKQSLEPMPARTARKLAASSSTDIWDEIAPALDWIFHNGPPPAPLPTLDNPLPTSINLSTTIAPTHLTLTDYFGHETDADLTFTVTLDNPIATIGQWDELISIKNTTKGTATMTVTASDGANSISATASVEAACNPGSRLSSDGSFCVAAQAAVVYNGDLPPYSSSPNGPSDGFVPTVRLEEGTANRINVRVWVNKPEAGSACRMRGYLTIEPQTGGATIPTGGSAVTIGNTTSPNSSAGQGWNDTNCTNSFLTGNGGRNYREARVIYNLPPADSTPGTDLPGAKLVYHDMGASGNSVVGTHDLLNINFRDSIATVTVTGNTGTLDADADGDGDGSTFTIKEATSGTQTVTLSGEHLIGYLAPRMQDIRKDGKASEARMRLEHGHAVYWQPSVCAFNKPALANENTGNRTATCEVSWDWQSDGAPNSGGTVKLVWHETDGAGWDLPDVHTTEVSTITMD